jgi:hypothetical protein
MDIENFKKQQEKIILDAINNLISFSEDVDVFRHGGNFDDRLTRRDLQFLLNTDKRVTEIQKKFSDKIKLKKINLMGVHILVYGK